MVLKDNFIVNLFRINHKQLAYNGFPFRRKIMEE